MAEILIPINDAWVQYTAAGAEPSFAYDFPVFDQDHIVVVETDTNGDDTTLVIGTDYTVTDVGELAGGDIVLTTAATADHIFTIYRDVPEARTTDFQQAGDFDAVTVNRELDLQTMQLQQLRRDFDRSARLPQTVLAAVSAQLPEPQADLLIGWASDGLSLVNKADIGTQTVSGYMATLLASASEAAFKTAANLEAGIDYDAFTATIGQAEAEAGTATTRRTWTAQRVNQAIQALTPPGILLQAPVRTEVTTSSTVANAQIPIDGTIPQSGEGTAVAAFDTAITPTAAASKLLVKAGIWIGEATNIESSLMVALFRDSDTDAIAVGAARSIDSEFGSNLVFDQVNIEAVVDASATDETTFKIRVGGGTGTGGNLRVNGAGSTDFFGAATVSFVEVREYAAP